jgi:hypothetical protein
MATSHKYVNKSNKVTFGAEFELVDWPRNDRLPEGMVIDPGWTQVNSNGIAVDGPGKLYHLGGEILARPCDSPSALSDQMATIKKLWPEATHNFRGGLHIHIRVPGLRDNLKQLKALQSFVHRVMPEVLPVIDPIPVPIRSEYPDAGEWAGARRHYAMLRRSHQTLLPKRKLELQMAARTPKEFIEAEALHEPTGKLYWTTQPRACVNIRQLLQTDTIEFRHYPGSADPMEVRNATFWCKAFMEAALDGGKVTGKELLAEYGPIIPKGRIPWPDFPPYDHWLYTGFMYTSRHFHTPDVVVEHIKEWLGKQRQVSLKRVSGAK